MSILKNMVGMTLWHAQARLVVGFILCKTRFVPVDQKERDFFVRFWESKRMCKYLGYFSMNMFSKNKKQKKKKNKERKKGRKKERKNKQDGEKDWREDKGKKASKKKKKTSKKESK